MILADISARYRKIEGACSGLAVRANPSRGVGSLLPPGMKPWENRYSLPLARLATHGLPCLREEAIGSILGCPKCGGMVLIVPPEGWVSAHATELAAIGGAVAPFRSGPPPLTKISQTFLTLDLEPEQTVGGWQKLLSQCDAVENRLGGNGGFGMPVSEC